MNNLLSTKEAAELSGYVPNYIRELARKGSVKSTLIGFSVMIHKDSLLTYIERQKKGIPNGQKKEV